MVVMTCILPLLGHEPNLFLSQSPPFLFLLSVSDGPLAKPYHPSPRELLALIEVEFSSLLPHVYCFSSDLFLF